MKDRSAQTSTHQESPITPLVAPPPYSLVAQAAAKEARAKLKTFAEKEQLDIQFTDLFHRKNLFADGNDEYEKPDLEEVRSLLEQGADVNYLATSSTGPKRRFTALSEAARQADSNELLALLLSMGATLDLKWKDQDDRQITALYMATLHNRLDNMVQLLDAGADTNLPCGDCGSALSTACAMNFSSAVELLLNHGADINQRNGRYGSALAMTADLGLKRMVELLLERGADVNLECGGRYGNALHAAIQSNQWEVVAILENHGVTPNGMSDRAKLATRSWRK